MRDSINFQTAAAAEERKRKRGMEEKASCSSSNPPDEISLFLHHFVLRSSASSSSSPPNCAPASSSLAPQPFFHHLNIPPPPHASVDGIPSSGIDPSFACPTAAARASHAPSSSSVGASENEADEYDCESEEGLEALPGEVPARPNTSRTSSKRSRTAEVHNLSEKRRRSRINEKMKALQSLIPNSNKTDKASMLDEAIEYLKQLQLQVQMLSMRNGLSLHPMCLPGTIQAHPQMRPFVGEEEEDNNEHLQHTLHQETPHSQTLFDLLEQRSDPSIPHIFTSDSPFVFNSSSQNHPAAARPFHLYLNSEEICRDDAVRHQQLNINNHSESSLFDKHASYPLPKPELNVGARETLSLPFGSQPSITKTEDPFRG